MLGQMQGKVICSSQSVAWRNNGHGKTPSWNKEAGRHQFPFTVSISRINNVHLQESEHYQYYLPNLLATSHALLHFVGSALPSLTPLSPGIVGPFPRRLAQTLPIPHFLTCAFCQTSVRWKQGWIL